MNRIEKAVYNYPHLCNRGSCQRETNTAMVEVRNGFGKSIICAFGEVCENDKAGNITKHLRGDYTFVAWHTRCAECGALNV